VQQEPDQAHGKPEDAVDKIDGVKSASNVLPRLSIHGWESSSRSRSLLTEKSFRASSRALRRTSSCACSR
jgi:hypothetical protein